MVIPASKVAGKNSEEKIVGLESQFILSDLS